MENIKWDGHTHSELCKHGSGDKTALMIEKAIARFDVDREKSMFIGDSIRDIDAAINAGIDGIKIESNQSLLSIVSNVLNE